MLFSLAWLRELCPTDRDARSVADALTARGLTVDSVAARGTDHVLDLDIPANRPDCLGHLGVAREISAAFGVPLASEIPAAGFSGRAAGQDVRVDIEDPKLCSRYTAGVVRSVRVGPSPDWVVQRLEICGLRTVNNAVDVSNLVLLQLGQPIHLFDMDKLATDERDRKWIRVRAARHEEPLRTLDGVERRLETSMPVIADALHAVALAGVMGGAETEIGPQTRSVLVEAARFDPRAIRSTSRRLGLRTDASFRFERGGDPAAPLAAQSLAARLLVDLAGGRPAPDIVDVYPAPKPARELTLRSSELERLLGFRPTDAEAREALERLHLSPEDTGDGGWRVTVPSWRNDLDREADLVEEVARHLGYDRIPAEIGFDASISTAASRDDPVEEHSRDILTRLGFHEALGYSMIASGEDDRFVEGQSTVALKLINPIAEPLTQLRRSILPGLVRAVDRNLRRGNRNVRLFEVGRVFHSRDPQVAPDELLRLGLAWSGAGAPSHWSRPDREVDLYDLLGVGEQLLARLQPGSSWTRQAGAPAAFHPGQCARWVGTDGAPVAWGGAVHPEIRRELTEAVYLLELELSAFSERTLEIARFRQLPRVPGVVRDLALVLGRDVTFDRVLETLAGVEPPAPVRFDAIDRYEGEPLEKGQISLTVRVTLQPLEKTLTDRESESYRRALLKRLEEQLAVGIRV